MTLILSAGNKLLVTLAVVVLSPFNPGQDDANFLKSEIIRLWKQNKSLEKRILLLKGAIPIYDGETRRQMQFGLSYDRRLPEPSGWMLPDGTISSGDLGEALRGLRSKISGNETKIQQFGERIVKIEKSQGTSPDDGDDSQSGDATSEMLRKCRTKITAVKNAMADAKVTIGQSDTKIKRIRRYIAEEPNYNSPSKRARLNFLLYGSVTQVHDGHPTAEWRIEKFEKWKRDAVVKINNGRELLARLERLEEKLQNKLERVNAQQQPENRGAGRGTEQFHAQMTQMGFLWVEGAGKYIDVMGMGLQEMENRINSLASQINRYAVGFDYGTQDIIKKLVESINNGDDPLDVMIRLQRLRNGIFIMWSAEREKKEADIGNLDTAGAALDLVTLVAPIVNDERDFSELVEGRDWWTGRELAWWERALSGVGLVAGSGAALRGMLDKIPVKHADRWRDIERALEYGSELNARGIKAGNLVDDLLAGGSKAERAAEELRKLTGDIPDAAARNRAFREMHSEAVSKVDNFEELMSGSGRASGEKKLRAVLEIQTDRFSLMELNRRNPELIVEFNKEMTKIYDEVDDLVKKEIADIYDISIKGEGFVMSGGIDDIEVKSITNPSPVVKAGNDRDVFAFIYGRYVPADELQQVYNKKMFDVLRKKGIVSRDMDPKRLANLMDQVCTDSLHPEAYNRLDLSNIISKPDEMTTIRLGDPDQIAHTISYKGVDPFNHGTKLLRRGGNAVKAEAEISMGFYQTMKQMRNQVNKYMDYARKIGMDVRLPANTEAAYKIMGMVVDRRLTNVQAERLLRELGFQTPQDIAIDVGLTISALTKRAVLHVTK